MSFRNMAFLSFESIACLNYRRGKTIGSSTPSAGVVFVATGSNVSTGSTESNIASGFNVATGFTIAIGPKIRANLLTATFARGLKTA